MAPSKNRNNNKGHSVRYPSWERFYAEGLKKFGGVASREVPLGWKNDWGCSKTKTVGINFFFSPNGPVILGTRLLWRSSALCSRPITRGYSRAKCRCRSSVTGHSGRFRRCPRTNSVSTRNWYRPACRVRLLRDSCPRWSENQQRTRWTRAFRETTVSKTVVLTNIRDVFTFLYKYRNRPKKPKKNMLGVVEFFFPLMAGVFVYKNIRINPVDLLRIAIWRTIIWTI